MNVRCLTRRLENVRNSRNGCGSRSSEAKRTMVQGCFAALVR